MEAQDITLYEAGMHVVLHVTQEGDVLLFHCAPTPFDASLIPPHTRRFYRLVEVQLAGYDHNDHHGNKHTGCQPGLLLRYAGHEVTRNEQGSHLRVRLTGESLEVECEWQFYTEAQTVRTRTRLQATRQDVCVTYVSAFALTGLTKGTPQPESNVLLSYAYNSWCGELQWQREPLARLGLSHVSSEQTLHDPAQYQNFSLQAFSPYGRGTWTTSEFLPMGCLENLANGTVIAWQVESSGPWQWEVSTIAGEYYLQCAGGDDERHHWNICLSSGESIVTPWTAVTMCHGTREDAFAALTHYRRAIVRPCADLRHLPVVFNDYMALLGDPTEEKLLPLIRRAAALGGEIFCVDSGWYADGNWWDSVGQWLPSKKRFAHGLEFVMQEIRNLGMTPGLWLEIEVMGVNCPLAACWPDECFFMRHGRRVIDHGRYQLDFTNEKVRRYADEVVDRLVYAYGVGYIKIDYNINAGYGTTIEGAGEGEGLRRHCLAYRCWLEQVLKRHPGLVIENCASGGMRMDYGMLSLLSLQSLTDQDEMIRLAPVSCAAPTAVLPEQAGCWSLPLAGEDEEDMVFSMVNTMLGRVMQSGALDALEPSREKLLTEALKTYATYREKLPSAIPFWPLGLPAHEDTLLALGMRLEGETLLAVWQIHHKGATGSIPLPQAYTCAEVLYPQGREGCCSLSDKGRCLQFTMPREVCARLYRLK